MPHLTLVYLCVLSSLMLITLLLGSLLYAPGKRITWTLLYTCQSHQAVLGRVVIVMRSTLPPRDVLRLIGITSQVSRYPATHTL